MSDEISILGVQFHVVLAIFRYLIISNPGVLKIINCLMSFGSKLARLSTQAIQLRHDLLDI